MITFQARSLCQLSAAGGQFTNGYGQPISNPQAYFSAVASNNHGYNARREFALRRFRSCFLDLLASETRLAVAFAAAERPSQALMSHTSLAQVQPKALPRA